MFHSCANIYTDSIYFIVESPQLFEELPDGLSNGINLINDTSIVLVLEAPFKQFVYVIGDWTDWTLDPSYKMKKTNDEKTNCSMYFLFAFLTPKSL